MGEQNTCLMALYTEQQEARCMCSDRRAPPGSSLLLWSFMIDDNGDTFHSRLHRLTRPLQVSTLWHGLAGFRQTGHNHHHPYVGKFPGWHHAVRVIESKGEG